MSDSIRIPVELSGMEKVVKKITATHAHLKGRYEKQAIEWLDTLQPEFEAARKRAGVKRGKFSTTVQVPINYGTAANPRIEDTPINIVQDLDAQNKMRYRRMQHDVKMMRNLESKGGIANAIKEQVKLVRDFEKAVKERLIPENMLLSAKSELKRLWQTRDRFNAKDFAQGQRDTIKATTESFKDNLTLLRSQRKLDTLPGVRSAIANLKTYIRDLDAEVMAGNAPNSMMRSAWEELRSLRAKGRALKKKEAEQLKTDTRRQAADLQVAQREGLRDAAAKIASDARARKGYAGAIKTKGAQLLHLNDVLAGIATGASTPSMIRSAEHQYEKARREAIKQSYTDKSLLPSERRRNAVLAGVETPLEQLIAKKNRRAAAQERLDARAKETDKRRSQMTMGVASAGIGLFGNAGFPLLNVAFASMSGMKYAGIAAAATAFGEAARAVMMLQDASFQSADALGLLSRGFKDTRAELEATKAFYGAMYSISKERTSRAQVNAMQANPLLMAPWMGLGAARAQISNLPFDAMNPSKMQSVMNPSNILFNIIKGTVQDIRKMPSDLQSARDSMWKQLNTYSARMEAPEAMWRRMQMGAASPMDDARKTALKQIEAVDKQLESAKKFAAAVDRLMLFLAPFGGNSSDPLANGFSTGVRAGAGMGVYW